MSKATKSCRGEPGRRGRDRAAHLLARRVLRHVKRAHHLGRVVVVEASVARGVRLPQRDEEAFGRGEGRVGRRRRGEGGGGEESAGRRGAEEGSAVHGGCSSTVLCHQHR